MPVSFLRRLTLCALCWLAPCPLQAEIYKCVSPDGKVAYRDSPCAKGTAQATDISSAVGECASPECEAQRARQAASAQQRLREEKEALSEMTQQRRQAEAEYAQERARIAEAQRLASVEQKVDMLLLQGNQPLYPGYPPYPFWPVTPPCTGRYCIGHPAPPIAPPGTLPPGQTRPKPSPINPAREAAAIRSTRPSNQPQP